MENKFGLEATHYHAIERLLNYLCFGQIAKPEPNKLGEFEMGDFKFSNPYYKEMQKVVADFLNNHKDADVNLKNCIYEHHPQKERIDKFLKNTVQHTQQIYYDTFYEGAAIRILIPDMQQNVMMMIYFPAIRFSYIRAELPYDSGNRTHLKIDEYDEIFYRHGVLLEVEEISFDDLKEVIL